MDKNLTLAIVLLGVAILSTLVLFSGDRITGAVVIMDANCGDILNNDTTLTSNLICGSGSDALIINQSNIVLDCQGHSITGPNSESGIHSQGYDNVTIKNCVVKNFAQGIYVSSSTNSTVMNNTVENSTTFAIYMNSGSSHRLYNNRVNNNKGDGVYIETSSYCIIDRTTADSNECSGVHVNSCFLQGTKILMADDTYKNIEDVKLGEFVKSYDGEKQTIGKVKSTFFHAKTENYLIINSELKLTPNHPLYVGGEWIEAGQVKVGDSLLDKDGSEILVGSIEVIDEQVPVYNLEVSGEHNYFAEDILVHNKCPRVFVQDGDDYRFETLINVIHGGEDNDKEFRYPISETNKIKVEHDPNEINYIDFIKLIVTDTNPAGDVRSYLIEPIACSADFGCDLDLLKDSDEQYILSDKEHPEFYLEFEQLPVLEQGYSRQVEIFTKGYQITTGQESPPDYVDEFMQEYLKKVPHQTGNNVTNSVLTNNGHTDSCSAIYVQSENNANVINNTINNSYLGIRLRNADGNTIRGNIVEQSTNEGILIDDGADGATIRDNTIIGASYGVGIKGTNTGSSFYNTIIQATQWISTAANHYFFENTTFKNTFGNIRILGQFNFTTPTNVTKTKLDVTSNKAFLNSSELGTMNQSAQITLNNIAFQNPDPQVDFEDDGTYDNCNSPQCQEISYSNNIYVFNVSSFTSYRAISGSDACGTLTSDLTLTNDVVSAGGNCFTISTDDVTLDCDDHMITGDGTNFGVYVTADRVTVKNCVIKNYSTGIYKSSSGSNATIEYNKINDTTSAGIECSEAEDWVKLRHNEINHGATGIRLAETYDGDLVEHNTIFDMSQDGMNIMGIINADIQYNTIHLVGQEGIECQNVKTSNFIGNTIHNSTYSGLLLASNSNNNTITGGEVYDNNQQDSSARGGIHISSSTGNTVRGVYLHDNKKNAVYLFNGAANTLIQGNNIDENCGGQAGVHVDNSANTTIKDNNITDGTGYGVQHLSGNNLKVIDNLISGNSNDAIRSNGGTGHEIKGNTINHDGSEEGIRFAGSNSIIYDNTIDGGECGGCYGIYISNNNNNISQNTVTDACDGIYVDGDYNTIDDNTLDGNDAIGCFSGVHLTSSATFNNLTNNNLTDNADFGLQALADIRWTITKEIEVKNNDVSIKGQLLFDGGSIVLDNSYITINGTRINTTNSTMTSFEKKTANLTANVSEEIAYEESDTNITFNLGDNQTGTVTISQVDPDTAPSGTSSLKAIEIDVESGISGSLNWALIKIFYDESELGSINEETLKMWFYNETSASWVLEPDQGVDTVNNYVWANVTHFSLFGAFGNVPATSTTTTTGGSTTTSQPGGGVVTIKHELGTEPKTVVLKPVDKLLFTVNGRIHTAQIKKIFTDHVTVTVKSTGQDVELYPGITEKVDVNDDDVLDLSLILSEFDEFTAQITFLAISEPMISVEEPIAGLEPVEESESEQVLKEKELSRILLLGLVVLIGLVVWLWMQKEKTKKKPRKR